jgi:hypothetical protein
MKQQAYKILWDMVAGRYSRKAKLPWKYIRYDPTDVVTYDYKGYLLETRLTETDFGSGLAREFTGVSQDVSAYDASSVVAATGTGSGSGIPVVSSPPPAPAPTSYTVSPTYALSEASPTEIDMVQVTVTWSDGRTTIYAARSGGSGFAVSDPGAGNSQLYYVTIYDPNRTGEVVGTPSLTAYCDITPSSVFLGQAGYIFIGTITITHDLVGVTVTSGGSQNITQAQGFYVNGNGGSPYSSQIDILTYMLMDPTRRATHHLQGIAANSQMSKNYTYSDPSTSMVAQIKAAAGWAADILVYDQTYIYQSVTELDDPGYRDWSVNTSYKHLTVSHGYPTSNALPVMPRYITPGAAAVTIDIPAPNPYDRVQACSVIDTLDKGHTTNITYGPVTMNFDSVPGSTGNLGNIQVIINERYAGNSARERFYWGADASGGLGFIKWDGATLVSGARITGQYKITNWSVHNQLTAGGGVSLSFGCGTVWP